MENKLAQLGRRLLMLLRRRQFDAELAEEMRLHRELREREQIERGLSPREARYAAHRRFGNDLLLREESRDMWGWNWLENLVQDVRYGLRMLATNPGFTAVAVLSLGLGIGANTTIFSFVSALLFQPPSVAAPDRLLEVWNQNQKGSGLEHYVPLAYPDYVYYRDHNHVFSGLAAFDGDPRLTSWSRAGQGERAQCGLVSGNFFDVLGIKDAIGRTFLPEEDIHGANPAIILSHRFWQQRLGADRGLGKDLQH